MKTILAAFAAVLGMSAGAASACPNFNMTPSFGAIHLETGFMPDPYVRNITAGGTQNISGCGGYGWAGYVPTRPDFSLEWRGNTAQLSILANTTVDAVMLVSAPDGRTWFYDDDSAGNLDPGITIMNPAQGRYDIWIGSIDGSRGNPGQLIITER